MLDCLYQLHSFPFLPCKAKADGKEGGGVDLPLIPAYDFLSCFSQKSHIFVTFSWFLARKVMTLVLVLVLS